VSATNGADRVKRYTSNMVRDHPGWFADLRADDERKLAEIIARSERAKKKDRRAEPVLRAVPDLLVMEARRSAERVNLLVWCEQHRQDHVHGACRGVRAGRSTAAVWRGVQVPGGVG
jgi:hypothetical protein